MRWMPLSSCHLHGHVVPGGDWRHIWHHLLSEPTRLCLNRPAAKMQGVSFLSPRGKFDLEFRDGSLQLDSKSTGTVECKLSAVESVFELPLPVSTQHPDARRPRLRC